MLCFYLFSQFVPQYSLFLIFSLPACSFLFFKQAVFKVPFVRDSVTSSPANENPVIITTKIKGQWIPTIWRGVSWKEFIKVHPRIFEEIRLGNFPEFFQEIIRRFFQSSSHKFLQKCSTVSSTSCSENFPINPTSWNVSRKFSEYVFNILSRNYWSNFTKHFSINFSSLNLHGIVHLKMKSFIGVPCRCSSGIST